MAVECTSRSVRARHHVPISTHGRLRPLLYPEAVPILPISLRLSDQLQARQLDSVPGRTPCRLELYPGEPRPSSLAPGVSAPTVKQEGMCGDKQRGTVSPHILRRVPAPTPGRRRVPVSSRPESPGQVWAPRNDAFCSLRQPVTFSFTVSLGAPGWLWHRARAS